MSKPSALTVAFVVAIAVWLLALALYWQLSQYDPYSWAFPGIESDRSRSLWLQRRALYLWIGVISFAVACALGVIRTLIRRRRRLSVS
jgi:hypothetical protein